jgi:hypothetical protein
MRRWTIGWVVAAAGCTGVTPGVGTPGSGEYEVTVRVVADSCARKYVPPEPWVVELTIAEEEGRLMARVPLSAVPPTNYTHIAEDYDIALVPATPVTRVRPRSMHVGCWTEPSIVATGVSRRGFTLALTTTYGEPDRLCRADAPRSCTSTVEQVFTRVEE